MGQDILNERQVAFLDAVKRSAAITRAFYLSGGTALATFYLHHRDSEDLDFFSEAEVDPLAIEIFLKTEKPALGFERFEFTQSFNRNLFFLHFADGAVLKTEFTYFPFPRIAEGLREGSLTIDSLRDIAVNKVFTISQQTRARDFIDLYCILRKEKWLMRELIADARVKFDTHIDLIQFGAQLMKADNLKDMPRMRIPFDATDVIAFFHAVAAKLKEDVLK